MRYSKFLIVLTISSVVCSLNAQESWSHLVQRVASLSPNEAAYQIEPFLQLFPKNPAPYYYIAELNYNMCSHLNPLRENNELRTRIYNVRLYFGNFKHFAEHNSQKASDYPMIKTSRKTINADSLYSIVDEKLKEIENIDKRTKNLYDNFYKMVNQYNRCLQIFSEFTSNYQREKNAHLLLSDDDYTLLKQLKAIADSLPQNIELFQNALKAYPIPEYQPDITFQSINLYGLEGLTSTNFLRNDIVLWDYADWVNTFLTEQTTTYSAIYRDITTALSASAQTPDWILLNRIEQLDYHSVMTPLVCMHQLVSSTQHLAENPILTIDSLPEIKFFKVSTILQQAEVNDSLYAINAKLLTQSLSEENIRKYIPVMKAMHWTDTTDIKKATTADFDIFQNQLTYIRQQITRLKEKIHPSETIMNAIHQESIQRQE